MSTFSDLLQAMLKATAASKVNAAFERFLEAQINISPGIRSAASTSQKHLREFLQGESSRDLTGTFPSILQKNDRDFLAGSFARHTKIWPLDDIDVFFPLDGATLVYYWQGVATPNTVVSDGGIWSNPLMTQRWLIGNYISSSLLVSEFAKVLRGRYPQSDVAKDGEAISVQLTIGSSEESDGLKFDVIPCFRLEPRDGRAPFYLIPDGHNGWKHTNPKIDEVMCDDLQKFHGGYYRKVVKILKHWNATEINGALHPYYIELALAMYFSSMQVSGQSIGSISQGVKLGFMALWSATQKGNIAPLVMSAPAVEPGTLAASQSQELAQAVGLSSKAVDDERAGQTDDAIRAWKAIFGPQFE
jgi:hypothetical protein